MAQDWTTLLTSHTLAASRTYINNAFETCRSTWSGTSAPSSPSPVDGQLFYHTTTNDLWIREGGTWYKICDAATYGGMLPLSAGNGYQLTGNIVFDAGVDNRNIKNLKAASAATDATNKQDVIDYTDAHTHDSGDGAGFGNEIHCINALTSLGTTDWCLLETAESDAMTERHLDYDSDSAFALTNGVYGTAASTGTTYVYENQPKYIFFGFNVDGGTFGSDVAYYKILRDAVELVAETVIPDGAVVCSAYNDTGVAASGNVDYKLEIRGGGVGYTASNCFIFVL